MTEEQIALARRAVACKGWVWMPDRTRRAPPRGGAVSIDLDALRERVLPMRDGFYHVVGYYRAFRREDFDSLIAEVERLRAFNSDLRLMVDGLETDAHEERAAVVAWLRGSVCGGCCAAAAYALADTIERGEHRRKGEP